jgi:kumamolisin
MKTTFASLGAVCVAFGLAGVAHADTDLGPSAATQTVSGSLILKVRNPNALEAYVAASSTPGSWLYHQFVSADAFTQVFSPSKGDISRITSFLAQNGITVTEVYGDRLLLKVTGPAAAFDQVFQTDLHDFEDAGHRYHRPSRAPQIPVLYRDLLYVIAGLDESASFKSHRVNGNAMSFNQKAAVLPKPGSTATGVPGDYTVGDFANNYDVNSVYADHIDGRGRTIGIATLAGFDPNDAYTYWSMIGLPVKANRITQVHVDGGGVISSAAGTGETCLDVEQSGGIAPQAKIVVYDAPNTDAGFIDVFYKAVSDNTVDTLSVSWGGSELFYYAAVGGTDETGELLAFHQVFLEGAAQGISMFASAGDDGAYDLSGIQGLSPVLSVDVPASDPAIVAAGGTTTPASMDFGGPTPLVITQEQVWGWDYLQQYFLEMFGEDITDEVYPTGGGGGVSIFWPAPFYQQITPGVRRTEPNQSVLYDDGDGTGPQDRMDRPSHFAGRNLPDVSFDADPETGYLLYSTPDGGLLAGFGGTSFVGPQLNGVTTLMGQAAGTRFGLLNPLLYVVKAEVGYRGGSPLIDITAGDNWFYKGVRGYDPGAGLGVLDVAKLVGIVSGR